MNTYSTPRTLIGGLLILTVSATLLMQAGCEYLPAGAKSDVYLVEEYPKVVGLDGLGNKLAMATPTVRGSVNGKPMSVSVPVRYMSDSPIDVQYRYIFLAADGRPLQPAMDWMHLTMQARVQTFISGSALSTDAVNWRLEIRPAARQ